MFYGKIAFMKDIIAFFGYPHPDLIEKTKREYKNACWLDIDIDYNAPKNSILPDNYCVIIKNIINNAFFYKDKIIKILAAVGRDKCDSGLFAAEILKDMGFSVETSVFEQTNLKKPKTFISSSNLPLKKKIELITANIIENKDYSNLVQTIPEYGFWGVPPNDLSILELFPDNTHVYGWTRCVELMSPYDLTLEKFVDKNVKTVFFAQTFCAKNQLAKYLADKYEGLYVDIDGLSNNSTRAKIEAFLRLK